MDVAPKGASKLIPYCLSINISFQESEQRRTSPTEGGRVRTRSGSDGIYIQRGLHDPVATARGSDT